jgi:hypothetical protein
MPPCAVRFLPLRFQSLRFLHFPHTSSYMPSHNVSSRPFAAVRGNSTRRLRRTKIPKARLFHSLLTCTEELIVMVTIADPTVSIIGTSHPREELR